MWLEWEEMALSHLKNEATTLKSYILNKKNSFDIISEDWHRNGIRVEQPGISINLKVRSCFQSLLILHYTNWNFSKQFWLLLTKPKTGAIRRRYWFRLLRKLSNIQFAINFAGMEKRHKIFDWHGNNEIDVFIFCLFESDWRILWEKVHR